MFLLLSDNSPDCLHLLFFVLLQWFVPMGSASSAELYHPWFYPFLRKLLKVKNEPVILRLSLSHEERKGKKRRRLSCFFLSFSERDTEVSPIACGYPTSLFLSSFCDSRSGRVLYSCGEVYIQIQLKNTTMPCKAKNERKLKDIHRTFVLISPACCSLYFSHSLRGIEYACVKEAFHTCTQRYLNAQC